MDAERKLSLIRWIRQVQQTSPGKDVLVPLEEYFGGNDERISGILANTSARLGAEALLGILRGMAARPEVAGCYIRITDYEDALDFADAWVGSDTVCLVTSAPLQTVAEWFESLTPSNVYREGGTGSYANPPSIPAGYSLVGVWWD